MRENSAFINPGFTMIATIYLCKWVKLLEKESKLILFFSQYYIALCDILLFLSTTDSVSVYFNANLDILFCRDFFRQSQTWTVPYPSQLSPDPRLQSAVCCRQGKWSNSVLQVRDWGVHKRDQTQIIWKRVVCSFLCSR